MDNTSYSEPAIVDMINKHFIPVRVDTDKRPDVNRRYNMGGWPTTAFLDGEGKVITGGTYIPPQQLREVLRSVLDYYSKNRGKARGKLDPVRIPKASGDPLSEKIAKDIATSIAVDFDIDYGGFGFEPKFPHTDALEYALLRFRYHGEREMLPVISRTLDKMGKGGIYDRVEDGFFRYSTTRDWSIPHYEKMAEDNAKLLTVYLHSFQTTGSAFHKEIAEGIVKYAREKLSDHEDGGFFGSQDADEEYYKLDLDVRKKRDAPSVDRTFYTNYNALFVSAFLLASTVLGKSELARFALKSLDRMMSDAWKEGSLMHYWGREGSDVTGLLSDNAPALQSLLDAYEYTGNQDYLRRAVQVAHYSLKDLYDEKGWGFYDIPETHSQIGELKTRDKPLDENSLMASALMRLSYLTDNAQYGDAAEKSLKIFVSDYERHGLMAASYAMALDTFLNGPIGITIVGRKEDKDFKSFKLQALRTYSSRRSVVYLDPSTDSERITKLGYDANGSATAYVCVGKACGPPLKDPTLIETTLTSLLHPTNPSVGN